MNKLPKYKKAARRIAGKKVKYIENKMMPPWGWYKSLSAFLAGIVNSVKRRRYDGF